MSCWVWTPEGGEEGLRIEFYQTKRRFRKIHRGELNLMLVHWKGSTLSGEASKQTSLPILERPIKILESGRSEFEGTVASNIVVTDEGAILHGDVCQWFPLDAMRKSI